MKSKANTTVTAFILLLFAMSVCGCQNVSVLCMPEEIIRIKQTGPEVDFTVPITVKKASETCSNVLVLDGKIQPDQVPFLWKNPEDNEWIRKNNNQYKAENIHEVLEYKIDISALEALEVAVKSSKGKAEGPYRVIIDPTPSFLRGRELGRKHQSDQLRTYRLLVELMRSYPSSSQTCESDREEFLRGFTTAYNEVNIRDTRGQRVADLLKKSLLFEDSIYRKLLEQGSMHEKGQLSNAEIAGVIRDYLNSPERELACKAGYIEGYVQAHPNPDKEVLYVDALWMYLAVRPPIVRP